VNTSETSPVLGLRKILTPALVEWGGSYLRGIRPSGSFAKGTANLSGTDIDLFISLKKDTPNTLEEIYSRLLNRLKQDGYDPQPRNVAINVRVQGYDVDLIPARHQGGISEDHSLYRRRAATWTQTNVMQHIAAVRSGGRLLETRVLKLWRDQHSLDLPSFYLQLTIIEALKGARSPLPQNVITALEYLRDRFPTARVVDPANSNNIISEELSSAEKGRIALKAADALGKSWRELIS
jgi:hypothetical protein